MRMFNENKFFGLLSTSSLLEGINTTAKNLIIYKGSERSNFLTPFQFYNLCGRAGRLNEAIVGNVYNYGGIWLDIGIEIFGSFDSFPGHRMF